jgi:hypothetical protein
VGELTEPEEIPWPEAGEELFRSDLPDWKNNACLNFDPASWFKYVEGYQMAGDILVEHVVQEATDQDFLVYPIVFSYRHALEGALKELIEEGSLLFDRPLKFSTEHDTRKLWERARPLLEKVWPKGQSEVLDAVGENVRKLGEVDAKSFSFRYPATREGNAYLPQDLRLFNIRHLSEQMVKLLSFIRGASDAIEIMRMDQAETESVLGSIDVE